MPRGNGGIIGPVNTSFSGVWSLTEAQLRRSGGTWPNFYAALLSESATGTDAVVSASASAADPYFEYTTLLLPGNGTNGAQNNTFLDGSTNNFTITRNGNTTQGTFSPFSQTGWGNYFDGSSYIGNTSTTSVVAAGTSNFTAEFWVYATTDQQSQAYGTVFHVGGATSGAWFIGLLYSSAGAMKIRIGTYAADYDSTSTIAPNRWYHIALVREGTGSNQTKVYVDGSLFHTFTLSDNFSNSSAIYVGTTGFNLAARRLSGYVSNLRFTVGTALYTTAFTPATSPLTTTSQGATASQVEVLTCQSNRFLDNSSNGWTFTTSGSPTVVAFSPFNPTASWSAATYGGSGYFDGSGDYLSVASTNTVVPTGTQDYAVEAWVYWGTQVTSYPQIISNPTTNGFQIVYDVASGLLAVGVYNVRNVITYAIAQSALANQWTHIVVTRSGNTHRMMVNGVLRANGTDSISFASPTTQAIGSAGAANYFVGYISSLRSVLGSIPTTYQTSSTTNGTAIFDPPTAPPTTTSQGASSCSLLLNCTNAGIYDATSKNDLETVGDAQISNTTAKWGSTSIKFDGTTDYLVEPTSVYFGYGTGDFTIECWVYFNSTGTSTIFSNLSGTASTNPHIYINSTIRFYDGGGDRITSSTSPSTGVWYHLAVCRASGSTRMFLNGTQTGSTYADTNDYGQSAPLGVGTYWNGGAPVTASTLNGYLQDVRVSKYARYTTNFTPPTAAFPTL
jgi:hypothetical protein